jgi:hypothetical protein
MSFFYVIEVIEHVLDGGRLLVLDKHPHRRDAHYPALGAAGLDGFVGLAARVTGRERTGVRMGDEHRLLGDLEGVERRAVARVGHVHRHPDLFIRSTIATP